MNNAIICNNIQFLLSPQAPFLESLTGWDGSPNWTCFFTSQIPFLSQSATKATVSEQWQKNYKQLHKENGSFGDKWHQFILRTGYPSCHPTSQPAVSDKKGNIMQWPPTTQLLQISPSQYLKKRYSPHTAYKTYYITCKRRAWATVILESSFLVKSVANS